MVRSMQVEDVYTRGLEAAERGVHLLKNTLTLQTCKREREKDDNGSTGVMHEH